MKRETTLLILLLLGCILPISAQNYHRVLAIGNSFSVDAAEAWLDDLAKADGHELIIGNLYIPGCSLDSHWNNAENNLPNYSFRKITNGDTIVIENQSILQALQSEGWDLITLQQASHFSGQLDTYLPYLPLLKQYVEQHTSNPNLRVAFHQTWAYSAESTHWGFANYDNCQITMYNQIMTTSQQAMKQAGIEQIIPSGTAIQNLRATDIGDTLCRDGFHLSETLGRYTAACTWYAFISGKSVVGNPFWPNGVPERAAKLAQEAAQSAIINPNFVTAQPTK